MASSFVVPPSAPHGRPSLPVPEPRRISPCIPPPAPTSTSSCPTATSRACRGTTPRTASSVTLPTVAVVGLGYVGLPTSLALAAAGFTASSASTSASSACDAIRRGEVDLLPSDHERLATALDQPDASPSRPTAAAVADADVVIICVPTPVDEQLRARPARPARRLRQGRRQRPRRADAHPDEHELRGHHARAARRARSPSAASSVGEDIFVAFSPERIDPGNRRHDAGRPSRASSAARPA